MISTVIGCVDLDAEVTFFISELGGRLHLVTPADDPERVVVDLRGARLELRRERADQPSALVVTGGAEFGRVVSPGGTVIDMRPSADLDVPDADPQFVVVASGQGDFGTGRAGMRYRDLLPGRWGGRFIASHIRIDDGGEVADWVHFHRIRFQMIFVAAGWVEVVYEDQGPPFRMEAGDCVLQPPEIRHRVVRSSAGLEVIEIGCPAQHDTVADHDLALPTSSELPDRSFGGQRFVRHTASTAIVAPWVDPSLHHRNTGIDVATGGLASVVVVGPGGAGQPTLLTHDGEFALIVGVSGSAALRVEGRDEVALTPGTSVAIPGGESWHWHDLSPDHQALVVTLPANAVRPS